jgi:hypothetical protein
VLIHAYTDVDDGLVWGIIQCELPRLRSVVARDPKDLGEGAFTPTDRAAPSRLSGRRCRSLR